MNYRRVGKAGIKVSEIALGAWLTFGGSVEQKKAEYIIHTAIDSGINFFDLADGYSQGKAEEVVGRAVKGHLRSDLVISSKLFFPMSENINDRGLSRKHIMESVEKSLRRIGTDYLDIYFCHRFDPETEVEETVRAMDDLIHQGKILYWGTSEWSAAQIERAVNDANVYEAYNPIVEQPCYNMLTRHIEAEIMPVCARNGIGLTVYSPLAQGLLTGKYNDVPPIDSRAATTSWLDNSLTQPNIEKARQLTEVALSLDITLSQLALAWVLSHPEVSSAIIGATSMEHVKENIAAVDVGLTSEALTTIKSIIDGGANER
ncbi:MAG: aldo/keto reductase [Aliifodinibius sp.]|nr:aldo/keto reductase [Fodinibius sp.]NIV11042.1 aldo/keto reductase [Fodinibius sp.]NIY29517.1 aldo/keto reductase [Fodinibius sp.]